MQNRKLLSSFVLSSVLLFSGIILPSFAQGADEPAEVPPRRGAWTLGVDVRDLQIKPSNHDYGVSAPSPDINAGYAHIRENWYLLTLVHLPVGPTSQRFPNSPPLDFKGYGVSVAAGYNLNGGQLRKPSGDYGVELGLESFELVGRSFRRQVLSDGTATESWVLRTQWIGISPAIFATFLKPARPSGNKAEWLLTRIEGYRVALGAVIPVDTSWDLRYDRDKITQGDRGDWKGVHALFSFSTWFGI